MQDSSNVTFRRKKMNHKTIQPPNLQKEMRAVLTTSEAAYHLNRSSQTLRSWACFESGPILPIRINGRLAWSTQQLRDLLGVNK